MYILKLVEKLSIVQCCVEYSAGIGKKNFNLYIIMCDRTQACEQKFCHPEKQKYLKKKK